MKTAYSLVTFLFLIGFASYSQNSIIISVSDSITELPVMGVKCFIHGTQNGAITDERGEAKIANIGNGVKTVVVNSLGYISKNYVLQFPENNGQTISVQLVSEVQEVEEIIIEATRANKSVADLPTRTEVLTEEIDEAASMEPSKIAHLITHSTGIQVQTTSSSSNGAVVRIQGLNGRYTQMLKDGFPLYGGFSGSLDILQIPPLDLRQVEYVKGSASTLYGGGAIGGLINLLTKKADKDETLLHINLSHIGAKDFNAFTSRKFGKWGFTNLASMHFHKVYDADGDNYSDVPEVKKFNFNPKLFYTPTDKISFYLGASISAEDRMGGDLNLINDSNPDSLHFYYDKQKSSRYTSQFSTEVKLSNKSTIQLKNSLSLFDRLLTIRQDAIGNTIRFGGQQFNSFTELNYNLNAEKHNLTIGANLSTEEFTEKELDTSSLRNQELLNYGLFANYLWDIHKKFALETGLRVDLASGKSTISSSESQLFTLPRMSALWKVSRSVVFRLGGGMGYRMPTLFNEEAEPYGYGNIRAINFAEQKAEESYGGNFDFKYRTTFGSDNLLFTFNQMFFYNLIENPILLSSDTTGSLFFSNLDGQLHSRGFESQIKFTFWKFTWFFGYTYTDAYLVDNNNTMPLVLTPTHSIKGDLLFVVDGKWRIGWDYEYKSGQRLSNGTTSPELFTTGIIVERTINNFVIFLNAENFTDTRQTRYESLLTGTNLTPQFTEVWGPQDGFFFNAGLKIKL